ncbi:uncharacterized protein LOC129770577 [Toxorhynchites rutilus septentrionalis]|uniref:uncharacterized protein LOC129770577 n=1 Tax=Toxorhynchites rutilus septentrionalis TaxID=329112 RepID=UPI00247B1E0F|nr:uncharacterized protein LOC129770577 [Toxorhynchites rutilus septentrionalis]
METNQAVEDCMMCMRVDKTQQYNEREEIFQYDTKRSIFDIEIPRKRKMADSLKPAAVPTLAEFLACHDGFHLTKNILLWKEIQCVVVDEWDAMTDDDGDDDEDCKLVIDEGMENELVMNENDAVIDYQMRSIDGSLNVKDSIDLSSKPEEYSILIDDQFYELFDM